MLNPRELDVLNILWRTDEPMMATDIVNARLGLTQSTVTAVLRKLLNEGLVEVVGIEHSGKVLGRTYRPTEISKDIVLNSFLELYGAFINVIDPKLMASKILELQK